MFTRIKNNPMCQVARLMWRYGEGRRAEIVLATVMATIGMGLWQLFPLVIGQFINRAQEVIAGGSIRSCAALAATAFLVCLLGWAFHGPSRVIEVITAFTVRRNIQVGLLAKVVRLPMRWHLEHHSGDTIDKIARASSSLAELAENSIMLMHIISRAMIAIIAVTLLLPSAGVFVIVATTIGIFLIAQYDRKLIPLYREGNAQLNAVATKVQDYLTNITTIVSLRLEGRVEKAIEGRLERYHPLVRPTVTTTEVKWFTTSTIHDFTRVATLLWVIFDASRTHTPIQIGTLFALNEYLANLGHSFFDFTWRYNDVVAKVARLKAVEFIEQDYDELVGSTAAARLPNEWQELSIENLSFRHPGNGAEAGGVSEIRTTFTRGKSYAIVGSSGSGKSTLLALLRGLHSADSGGVRCDGAPISDGLAAVSHHTTLIPQDPEVFAESVRSNVTMDIEAPRERILSAIEMARFSDVLERLPRGLETNIAEKGISLSGGEKQRLALARGLFFALDGDSEIILLDESTSSVDIVNEKLIFEALLRHFRQEVVIATIHKFNLLPLFDEIIVMNRGRIVEQGSLEGLLTTQGHLAKMWKQYVDATSLSRVA